MRGATENELEAVIQECEFQPALPVKGATMMVAWDSTLISFQSTLPVRGNDHRHRDSSYHQGNFNPHAPYGE